ncbi:hypothetical protein [Thermomonospora umbrina]|uniref:Uncharacterized protein n=1 Tax=Thermomonospora umbrina TaxID=111806 RepID=A0A3D9SJ77_9ACTN|nr:hypothetical protein [Thermomonospora umbrina]REE95757.1 hypothetical protein DFJ69_1167 [Thermomonospora umbrina]
MAGTKVTVVERSYDVMRARVEHRGSGRARVWREGVELRRDDWDALDTRLA